MKEYNIKSNCLDYCINETPITAKSKQEAIAKFITENPKYARMAANKMIIAEIIYPNYDPLNN